MSDSWQEQATKVANKSIKVFIEASSLKKKISENL